MHLQIAAATSVCTWSPSAGGATIITDINKLSSFPSPSHTICQLIPNQTSETLTLQQLSAC